ncbi:MAG: glycosyltransferase [Candidatus Pacebacteria bacterium]|jgi:polysaccharide biosynthesis protein PslH|nr:glycosyltransferase [Candidatus Paceibacterota bacterium]MBT3512257.1 glycosyltransferase [Candidatus Paceibacterota bacterium]MBT4004793.1 glycosyltransferase [Candidatus Paceibacterota bacterium]MBT4358697.1 glycosyltransferase [Candidatus Paceibacterota bacterium]MBT4681000.1 glycosyltransferase [Candidatus Paceibacterota bacterium]
MKILMLTPYLPYPLLSGGQIRTYNLLKKLAKEHEITLFPLIKEESERQYIPELEKYCAKVKVFKRSQKPFTLKNIYKTLISTYPFLVVRNHVPEIIGAVREELANDNYDLIHAETFYMMPHLPKTNVPIILVEQTIEYLGYESYAKKAPFFIKPLLQVDINKIKKWERHFWRSAQKLIVMSQADKDYIANEIGDENKIEVVANGVDSEWFNKKRRKPPEKPTVLSVGTFNWLPNIEAVKFLVNRVWPLLKQQVKDVQLWIVGNAPTQEILNFQKKDSGIKVTGNIPDIRDAFKSAHVVAAPVFSGKGTRYKILEAMAAGTPVVATSIAVEGLGVEDGKHVILADTAALMSDKIARLLDSPEERSLLSRRAKKFVTQQYDWKYISSKLDEVYQEFS